MEGSEERGRGWRWLLLVPFAAVLAVPLYNRDAPRLAGVPFFYWYQMLWILLSAAIIFLVHRIERVRIERAERGGKVP
jgi:hypothetical protein|uniref:DUF3311 domain-containing protein n=1 Tax=Acidicaldus sp. TaxID=1872105 RepID=A0A8J4HBC1_9PROT